MVSEHFSRSRSAKWRSYAISALLLIVAVAGARAWQQRDMPDGPAPALQGEMLAGRHYTPGRPLLVHFWATWCPVCRAEQSAIDAIAHDHPNIVTIAMQSGTSQEVARYMKEQGMAFPVMNDPDGRIAGAWGVHAVPASFIVGPDGRIRFVEVGYTTAIGLRVRLWLAGV